MKKHVLLSLQIIALVWALVCAVLILPKVLIYDPTTAYGIGAMVGTVAAFILVAFPGLFAAKGLFFSKREVQS